MLNAPLAKVRVEVDSTSSIVMILPAKGGVHLTYVRGLMSRFQDALSPLARYDVKSMPVFGLAERRHAVAVFLV